MTEQWVQFVRHHDEEAFHALGWRVSNRMPGDYAGQFSIIMQWEGDGEPRTPLQNQPDRHYADSGLPVEGSDIQPGSVRTGAGISEPGRDGNMGQRHFPAAYLGSD